MSDINEYFMNLAFEEAKKGFPHTRQNPLVGAVIVKDSNIISSGYHRKFGSAHAEVNAIEYALKNGITVSELSQSDLYVTLEPCSHIGKTPPCVDKLIQCNFKNVFISNLDPNPLVNGTGVKKLLENGIKVTSGILEETGKEINRRFFCYHNNRRPYVVLKWAQTADGFIARKDFSSKWITSEKSRAFARSWRTEEIGIMIGTNTGFYDNPMLTSRIPGAVEPIRIIVDRIQRIPTSFHVFDESVQTVLYNELEDYKGKNIELVKIDFNKNIIPQILSDLFNKNITSMIIEGGAGLINSFLELNIWDEARIFISDLEFKEGIKAPDFDLEQKIPTTIIENDKLFCIRNLKNNF